MATKSWSDIPRLTDEENELFFKVYVLAMAGRSDDARELARRNRDWLPDDEESRRYWQWMEATFGLAV